MEYFSSNGLSENLSLHDMIECDIKSEFCERTSTADDPILTQAGLDQHPSFHIQQTGQNNLVSDIRNNHFTHEQQQKLSELSWLQTIHGLTSISSLLQPENTDPNLMVNPQTGLPAILQAQGQCHPTEEPCPSPQNGLMHTNMSMLQHTNQQPQEHMNFMSTMSPSIPTTPQRYQQPSSPRATTPSRTMSSNVHYPKSPLISQHLLQTSAASQQPKVKTENGDNGKVYPKPMYSYSCLIAMALKNSDTGALPVSEIYSFMTENFPYFKSAPDGWKNSVRHNLSLNKCFEKIENPKASGSSRKGCLWGLHPAKIEKMEEEIAKWRKKDPAAIKRSMAKPEVLERLEIGQVGSLSPRHPNNIRANSNSATYRSPSVRCIYPPSPTMHTTPTKAASAPVIRMFDVTSKISEQGQGQVKIKTEDSGYLLEDVASGLDNCVDPALTDLALQNSLWEDIGTETLNLEDIPFSAACNLSFSNGLIPTSSILHLSPVTGLSSPNGCPQYTGVVCVGGQSPTAPTPTPQSQGGLTLSRTLLAQT